MVDAVGVGFVGLGDIGAPMARRLAGHVPVRVWARRREATAGFADVAASLAELGDRDVVGVCVTDDRAVRDVVGDLLPHLRPGAVVAVHSTVHPATVQALAADCRAARAALLDCPVSGGSDGAERGALLLLAGGDSVDVERCRPLLEVLGTVHHVGGVGAGQQAKILNNALYTANAAVGAAAVDVGESLGLDRAALVDALRGGSGASFALGRLERLHDPDRAGHFAGLLAKDLDLFESLAGDHHTPLPLVGRPFLDRLRSVARA